MTYREFKETVSNRGGFVTVAAEDIPGFYRKGDHMYGDCDRMIVSEWLYQPLNGIYTVFLNEEERR